MLLQGREARAACAEGLYRAGFFATLLIALCCLFPPTALGAAPDAGPGGPVLVVTTAANPFSSYYAEILRAEGLNEFTVSDISAVTAGTLDAHDVAILGEMPLTAPQVQMLSDWVQTGGNLIAMRPDHQLAGLLGLTDTATTLSNSYLKVDSSLPPGAGIVSSTIQFHGVADRFLPDGATTVATLYSDATTTTSSPAVSLHSVGPNGGQAAAFTYDLARSVVYTRQGNPDFAGQKRDGQAGPIRSDDLYYGAASFDPQADWVDLGKVAIPQADEQQRLLTNLIGHMNVDRKPLPRFWFLPRDEKATIVMTGDDHGSGGTAGRFDQYRSVSPPGCSVADWECVRGTSYIYTNTPLSDEDAAAYEADGFEVGLHVTTFCDNWTPELLESLFANQLAEFNAKYTSVSAPTTNRTHCIAWSDWATEAKVELANGIRLDTNYYYWPQAWIQDRPGMFTGSGAPMRFADLDGSMIDVYQAATQMTDESGQSYPLHVNALLDRALGSEGYYGVFTANMHTDNVASSGSDAIVASALARGVPVVTARQMLEWLDGRNNSSFESLNWDGSTLAFAIDKGAGSNGLRAMVPTQSEAGTLTNLKRNGSSITTTTRVVKGVEYAFFDATAADYEAIYAADTTPPVVSDVVASPGAAGTAEITWSTDEMSVSRVDYGTAPNALDSNMAESVPVASHSLELTGLLPNTTYHYRVSSTDGSGNTAASPPVPDPPASFTTPSGSLIDTSVADFGAGTPGTNTYVGEAADGEVVLNPAVGNEFSGASLPLGWFANPWIAGGAATVSGGRVAIDDASVGTNQSFGPGRALEFGATFENANTHIGFGQTFNEFVWAIFSVKTDGQLYARTANGSGTIDTLLPSSLLGSPHHFRVAWNENSVEFFVDGTSVSTHATNFGSAAMRPLASDFNGLGTSVTVDWMRLSPYAPAGTFTSRVLDAGLEADWGHLSWDAGAPAGTAVALSVRTGDTPVPNGGWSEFEPVGSSGGPVAGTSRYIQYRAALTSSDSGQTPVLREVDIAFAEAADTPPTIVHRDPAPGATGVSLDANVAVDFSEPMDASTIDGSTVRVRAEGASTDVAATVSYANATATLDPDGPLAANTTYEVTVAGSVKDEQGNPLGSDSSWPFETEPPPSHTFTDTTTNDFWAGTSGSATYVSETGDGEVMPRPTEAADFSDEGLPDGWSSTPWNPGGAATAAGGKLTVDGTAAGTTATYGAGHTLEFVATFGSATFQHAGFSDGFQSVLAIFSTFNTTTKLYARTSTGSGSPINEEIPGSFIGSSHRYRIEWSASDVKYFIDGDLVATHPASYSTSMWPLVSDFDTGGETFALDWLHMSPYTSTGTFLSRVFDAGDGVDWGPLSWSADTPSGTSLQLSVRMGDTPTPDETWSDYQPVATSGEDTAGNSRYLQYRAELSSSDLSIAPVLHDVTIGYAQHQDTSAPQVVVASISPSPVVIAVTSTDVTWHATENGGFSVRVGGDDCTSGNMVGSGTYETAPAERTITVQSTDLSEGLNTVRVCVADAAGNTGSGTGSVIKDTQIHGYPRPKSAAAVRTPLVIAFTECTSPDLVHGPPLDHPSCSSPTQASSHLTVGTPDVNGNRPESVNAVRMRAVAGDPHTEASEADVAVEVSVTDVRRSTDLSDYPGELLLSVSTRMTDAHNGPDHSEPTTASDFEFTASVPCLATPGPAGSTCTLSTTANALTPGSVIEGKRTIRELGQVQVFDGGADDLASTDDNSLFAVEGIFVP